MLIIVKKVVLQINIILASMQYNLVILAKHLSYSCLVNDLPALKTIFPVPIALIYC